MNKLDNLRKVFDSLSTTEETLENFLESSSCSYKFEDDKDTAEVKRNMACLLNGIIEKIDDALPVFETMIEINEQLALLDWSNNE